MRAEAENVLIVSMRRSGGKLMRNLLDGHSQVRSLPMEHWHAPRKATFPAEALARYRELTATERVAIFHRRTPEKIERLHGPESSSEFMQFVTRDAEETETAPDLYQRFVERYFAHFHNQSEGRAVNHCGNLALLSPDELDRMFGPSLKIIIWRDPRAAYVSSRELAKKKTGRVFGNEEVAHFCKQYRLAFSNHGEGAGHHHISISFEQLLEAPVVILQQLADALNIEFRQILTIPTLYGKPHFANTSFERQSGVVDRTASNDWSSRITAQERLAIERALGDVMLKLNYSV
jgi:hypothetical protein